ncbi:MAG: ParB N-terminal domain-containing protein [Anaerolineales bacterium]|nr:ParB N-terminal domain-containing protein [Anaerolineales bacterium]
MPTTAIKHLKPHPAQMRTTYDLDALAALALQVYERGLDTWQPIVAAKNETGFHIVSGHRRHMAQLLAYALQDWAQDHPDTAVAIEVVRTMVQTLVESLGSLKALIASLVTKYGEQEIAFVSFEGGDKAEILALQAANYGGETPDALGVAHSFRQAAEAGATEEEMARNAGQHVNYVRNHLALTHIPPELAGRIAAGELPMSVATAVADLPEPKRAGLAIFILANEPGQLTAKAIKECAAALKKWPGLQMPLMVKHQSQRNVARALMRLWGQVVEAYPEDAYAAAAMLIYRGVQDEPWSNQEKLTLWFQTLGGDTYFTGGGIHWPAVVEHLLNEVSCEACPIARLPDELLREDLSQGQGGPLGMPCRAGEEATRCLHGLTPADPFDVRVPWSWSEHPGVVHEGEYRVKSYEDLLAAWQAQAAREQAEREREQGEDEAATSAASDGRGDQLPTTASEAPAPAVSPTLSTAGAEEAKPSPVARQRVQIADFMKRHEQLAANHPFATPCGRCRHRLESSPTKDESVPHCTWAGRLRSVDFKVLATEEGALPRIPVCRQFAPNQPWPEIIPGHPEPPGLPRAWLKAQILQLVQDANRRESGRNTFEFLTGRPLSASENYGDWFAQQMESQGGDLSLGQLFTLFIWAHSEWQRARRREFTLPVNEHGVQFSRYKEVSWPMKEES